MGSGRMNVTSVVGCSVACLSNHKCVLGVAISRDHDPRCTYGAGPSLVFGGVIPNQG